jgi:predicted transcriptional regulator
MAVAAKQQGLGTLPQPLKREVERAARREGRPTTAIIRTALKRYLEDEKAWAATLAYGERKAKELGLRSDKDIQRAIDEYRRGNLRPYAPARRR